MLKRTVTDTAIATATPIDGACGATMAEAEPPIFAEEAADVIAF